MDEGDIQGLFTNHSLDRSGGIRLFRDGVDRKLVTEVTSHRLDAVGNYQITGCDQQKMISKVVQGEISNVKSVPVESNEKKTEQIAKKAL